MDTDFEREKEEFLATIAANGWDREDFDVKLEGARVRVTRISNSITETYPRVLFSGLALPR